MNAWRFEAIRGDGALVRGRLDADHSGDAIDKLAELGLTAVAVRAIGVRRRALSDEQLAVVFRGLSTLIDAGLPLDAALGVVGTDGHMHAFVGAVRRSLAHGHTLADAFEAAGRIPPVAAALVRSGERFGLAFALARAADQLERDGATRHELRSALAYPALLGVVGLASVVLLVTTVLPRFVGLLEDVGAGVPVMATAAIGMGELASAGWIPALVVTVLLAVALRSRPGATVAHRVVLALPVVGAVRARFVAARIARVLGALLGVGVPALDALRVAAEAGGDHAFAERIERAGGRVQSGASLSAALRHERALPVATVELLAAGERAGRAADLLARAADLAEEDGRRRLRSALRLLEPALVVLIGAGVALAALTLLQAVYGIELT